MTNLDEKNLQLLADNIEILTREQFWKRNPAPGTIYTEMGTSANMIVAHEIDVHTQEPDDILSSRIGVTLSNDHDTYIVFKWGSWEGNEKYLDMHDEAARIMDSQAEPNTDYSHDDCRFDRSW